MTDTTQARHTDPAPPVRAVRFTLDGDLDVIEIPARYDAVADAIGAPHRVGDIGITSVATWKMTGAGHLTFWAAHSGRIQTPRRNDLATKVANRLVPPAEGTIDRITDSINAGALAGTVVLAGYNRATGDVVDVGDVAVERVRVVVDGRGQARVAAAPTTALALPAPTTALPVTLPAPDPAPAPEVDPEPEQPPAPQPAPEPEPAEAGTKRVTPKRQRTPGPVS